MFLKQNRTLKTRHGFTLIEVVVVVAIIAVVIGISMPSILSWRDNLQYRQIGSDFAAAIRDARSRAVAGNKQYEVELTATTYRVREGNKSVASSTWTTPTALSLPTGTSFVFSHSRIIANPNGTLFFDNTTADPVFGSSAVSTTIQVQNTLVNPAVTRYEIGLSQVGKVTQKRKD